MIPASNNVKNSEWCIAIFKDFAIRSRDLQGRFKFGGLDEVNADMETFPYMYVAPSDILVAPNLDSKSGYAYIEASYDVVIADKIKSGKDNELQTVSDSQEIMMALIAELGSHPYYVDNLMKLVGDVNLVTTLEQDDAIVSKVTANITLRYPFKYQYCNQPVDNIPFYPEITTDIFTSVTQSICTIIEGCPVIINIQNEIEEIINSGIGGATGATGPQGVQGPAGGGTGSGTQGPQGFQGPTGDNGSDGVTGPQGVQGPAGGGTGSGTQGPQGPSGGSGSQGPQGFQGPTGPTGPTGPQGDNGNDGVTGPQGNNGNDGSTGPQGNTGPQGPSSGGGSSNIISKSVLTGTASTAGTESIITTIFVPADTFATGDIVILNNYVTKTASSFNWTAYFYVNSTPVLSGALLIGRFNSNSPSFRYNSIVRSWLVKDATTDSFGYFNTTATGYVSTEGAQLIQQASFAIDWTADNYLMVTAVTGGAETAQTEGYVLEKK